MKYTTKNLNQQIDFRFRTAVFDDYFQFLSVLTSEM